MRTNLDTAQSFVKDLVDPNKNVDCTKKYFSSDATIYFAAEDGKTSKLNITQFFEQLQKGHQENVKKVLPPELTFRTLEHEGQVWFEYEGLQEREGQGLYENQGAGWYKVRQVGLFTFQQNDGNDKEITEFISLIYRKTKASIEQVQKHLPKKV